MGGSRPCPFCYSMVRACLEGSEPSLKTLSSCPSQQDLIQAHNVIVCKTCQFVMQKFSELIVNNATEVCQPPCMREGRHALYCSEKVPWELSPGECTPQYSGRRSLGEGSSTRLVTSSWRG